MSEFISIPHEQILDILMGESSFAEYEVIVCYQTAKKHRKHERFTITAKNAEEAGRLILEAYRVVHPRRKQAWVKSVERVYE